MKTLKELYEYARTAEASYALITNNAELKDELIIKADKKSDLFTKKQATAFANDYEFISQSDDKIYGDSGFSATVFKHKETGQYVFAMRGTDELIKDILVADAVGVAIRGLELDQVLDMYNYYQQLLTPKGEKMIQQQ